MKKKDIHHHPGMDSGNVSKSAHWIRKTFDIAVILHDKESEATINARNGTSSPLNTIALNP